MLNIVKVPKLEMNICKNVPCKLKVRSALIALFAMLPLLPPHDDVRLFVHVRSVAFVARSVAKVVCVVRSHISDQIWA